MSARLAASANATHRLRGFWGSALLVQCVIAVGCDEHETTVPLGAAGSADNGKAYTTNGVGGSAMPAGKPGSTKAGGGTDTSAANATTLPAEGSASVTISNSATAPSGYSCGAAHTLTLGNEAPSATAVGVPWIDGVEEKAVSCAIGPDASSNVAVNISGYPTTFQLTADAITPGGENTATVSLFDPKLALNMYDENCRIDASSGNFSMSSSGLWLSIHCDHLISKDDKYLWCAFDGIVAVSNCTSR